MYIVADQQNVKMALIYHNMILSPNGDKVLGIAVGDCLFSGQSKVFGKLIQSNAYDLNGNIIGRIVLESPALNFNLTHEQVNHSWNILSNIKEHTCPWIDIKTEWSLQIFSDYLLNS